MHAAPADWVGPVAFYAAAFHEVPCSLQISTDSGASSALCISAIIPGGDPRAIILGNNFMRSWFTVYTYDVASRAAHVGFGAAAAMASSKRCGGCWAAQAAPVAFAAAFAPKCIDCFCCASPVDDIRACAG